MTIRVCDLAKKIGTTSKEVVAKAVSMGIGAKAANSPLTEENAKLIEDAFNSSENTSEKVEKTAAKPAAKEAAKTAKTPAERAAAPAAKRRLVGTPMTKAQKADRDAKLAKEKEEILAKQAAEEAAKAAAEKAEAEAEEAAAKAEAEAKA
ncbi:MAG: translation initiation factor IF-2 N-terminal domain-containing protein, partial [Eubacterium sp.]|nr:translation initiation factor IF-2 N-terminal domain-containing protein [Eubacterium sp.]